MTKWVVNISKNFTEVVPPYLSDIRNKVRLMKKALSTGNLNSIKEISHQIKGNAGGFGFSQLGDLSASLESAANENNKKEIERFLKQIKTYLNALEVNYE